MIYLYAITRQAGIPLPEVGGLPGHNIERVSVDNFDAIISRCTDVSSQPDPDLLWSHEALIEALMKNQCALPVRYGVCFSDMPELIAFLNREKVALLEDLKRLDGCIELSFRVINPAKKLGSMSSNRVRLNKSSTLTGKSFLNARLSEVNRQREDQQKLKEKAMVLHEKMLQFALDGSFEIHTHPLHMMTGAYLLRKDELYALQQQVGQMRALNKEYRILCTGPWPPYNFVTPIAVIN